MVRGKGLGLVIIKLITVNPSNLEGGNPLQLSSHFYSKWQNDCWYFATVLYIVNIEVRYIRKGTIMVLLSAQQEYLSLNDIILCERPYQLAMIGCVDGDRGGRSGVATMSS